MKLTLLPLALATAMLAACGGGDGSTSVSADVSVSPAPASATGEKYRTAAPANGDSPRLDARLRAARGPVEVWVSLALNSVAAERGALAESVGLSSGADIRGSAQLSKGSVDHVKRVEEAQASLASKLSSLGATELARVKIAHNAIALRIDAAQLNQLASLDGVARVRPVLHYEMTLSTTVPYVGASTVQATGRDGSGVTVAVLDSGIDYTHRNLGGVGTLAAYAAAYGADPADAKNTTLDGLFPTAKVVGGYDFVGETWGRINGVTVGTVTEDPDPIDLEGHGTHVADIIAGKSVDGTHVGVAPGAKLVAVKVCSAISSACNGVALLKGMDFALDPNGDGDTDDAVDVINLSLGSGYGQVEDDLSAATANAVKVGVVVVAAAGNDANKPYVVSSPSIAPGVISVAQTALPTASAIPLVVNAPASIAGVYGNTQTVDWAPVGAGVTGDVVFIGRGCPGDALRANPTGKIALIDRGACSVSLKVDYAVKAGATGVLIGLVAPGDAVTFSFGGGTDFRPTLVIQQSLSTAIKARLTAGQVVNASISPAAAIALVGSMASSSARGPSIGLQLIKPEIGAPGASTSAEAGTGAGQTAFGGTSGAAPMVAGAAALMLQIHPQLSPEKIKALMMNSAETTVFTNPATAPGQLAPITRIGAGELRVNRAAALTSLAYNRKAMSAALSFGALEVSRPIEVELQLRVQNLSSASKTFTVTPSFRFANDAASGAVRVVTSSSLRVGGGETAELDVKLVIDPKKLPAWTMNGGSQGGNGAGLNGPEYDGYITLTAGSEKLSVPWHVLPRKAAETDATLANSQNAPALKLRNRGADVSEFDVFSLAGVNKRLPSSVLPQPGDNFAVIDMRSVGVRFLPDRLTGVGADLIEFAINTSGRRSHPNYPAEFDIEVDTTGDGIPDYVIYNAESGGFAATGQNQVFVFNLTTGRARAFFFTDADLNSGNVIFTVPLNIAGGLALPAGRTIGFSVFAFDNYFTGNLTDSIEGMRFTPATPRFGVVSAPFAEVPASSTAELGVTTATLPDTASSELGLLLMYRRNAGAEADAIRMR